MTLSGGKDIVRICKKNGHVFTNNHLLQDSSCPKCDEMQKNTEMNQIQTKLLHDLAKDGNKLLKGNFAQLKLTFKVTSKIENGVLTFQCTRVFL